MEGVNSTLLDRVDGAQTLTKKSIPSRGNDMGKDWELREEFVVSLRVRRLANFS